MLKGIHSAMLDAAPQPQDEQEPVAIPDECPHIIWFDDSDVRPMMFAGNGARDAALKAFERVSVQWNAHLFVRIQKNSRDDQYPCAPLYTNPQPKREPLTHYEIHDHSFLHSRKKNTPQLAGTSSEKRGVGLPALVYRCLVRTTPKPNEIAS